MKKDIKYSSPKEYQVPRKVEDDIMDDTDVKLDTVVIDGEVHELLPEVSLKKKPPKAKVCRKLKGPHQYGDWEEYHFGWEKDKSKPNGWYVRFCTACHRKEDWIAPGLPGPYYRKDLSARPPGYKEKVA